MAKQIPAYSYDGTSYTSANDKYWYIFLTSSGTLRLAYDKKIPLEIAVVGGGGSGASVQMDGGVSGGSGGGGGSITVFASPLQKEVGYPVVIGAGGNGHLSYTDGHGWNWFTNGSPSSFRISNSVIWSAAGGNGAHTGRIVQEHWDGPGPKHDDGDGRPGAAGTYKIYDSANNLVYSGSTGAGGLGGDTFTRWSGANGQNGGGVFELPTFFGAGGGGGGSGNPNPSDAQRGKGGKTGGGNASMAAHRDGTVTQPAPAQANTGAGGGGAGGTSNGDLQYDYPGGAGVHSPYGGAGGSGIVIIRGTEEDLVPIWLNGVQLAKITFNGYEVASALINGLKIFIRKVKDIWKRLVYWTDQPSRSSQGSRRLLTSM